MKHFVISLLIIWLFVFVSCHSNSLYAPNKLVKIERPIPMDTLKSEYIYLGIEKDTNDLYFGREIRCVGPYVVQLTTSDKHYIKMIDLRNPEKVVLFGSQGRAGDEFIIIPQMLNTEETENGDLLIYCTDIGKSSVVCIDAEASYREEKCIVKKVFPFFSKSGFNTFFPFVKADSGIIAGYQTLSYRDARDDIYSTPKLIFYDSQKESICNVYPEGIVNSNHILVTLAYCAASGISPDRSKIVESLYNVDITNIWNTNTKEAIGVVGKDEISLDFFEITNRGEYYDDSLKQYTCDVALSNDMLFRTSLRGVSKSYYLANQDKICPTLEVYDYDGVFLSSFVLEQKHQCIAYSEYYDCLFSPGFGNDLFKYELPQWLKKKQ